MSSASTASPAVAPRDDATGAFDADGLVRAGRRVVRFDARGHGRSGGQKVESDYAWPNLARDLLALLDELEVEEAVSGVGASMGQGHAPARGDARPRPLRPARAHLPADGVGGARTAQAGVYRAGALRYRAQLPAGRRSCAGCGCSPGRRCSRETPEGPVDIDEALLPTVMRGAASSDLPPPEAISDIRKPTLILAWDGDPGHPVATAERLHELIPGSALHVARTPQELRAWSDRTVGFLR